jgi:hypothetical protein
MKKWQDLIKVDNVIPLATVPVTAIETEEGLREATEVQAVVCHESSVWAKTIPKDEVVQVNSVETGNSYDIQYTTEQLSAEQSKDKDLHLILH